MKTFRKMLAGLLVVAGMALLFTACQKDSVTEPELQHGDVIKGQYIVVFQDAIGLKMGEVLTYEGRLDYVRSQAVEVMQELSIERPEISQVYGTAIQGFAASMSEADAEVLQGDPRVRFVEPDRYVCLDVSIKAKPTPQPPAQAIPWGITRVGGAVNYTGPKKAWVIDTGIDLTHPDLNVNTALSVSFVPRVTSPNDDNGHGSHVAGTIAAKNDNIGVVGVAAGAWVVAVKVLDRRGSGAYSTIIAGVDYVGGAATSGDVANMSLGGPISDALDAAVLAAAQAGIKFALAAGNESTHASTKSPARVNHANVFTISAIGQNNAWASFSNYGNPPVDYAAPGVSIYSTYKSGGYATLSGTSMASPHVAGILMLGNISTDGYAINDPDGNPDPIAHR